VAVVTGATQESAAALVDRPLYLIAHGVGNEVQRGDLRELPRSTRYEPGSRKSAGRKHPEGPGSLLGIPSGRHRRGVAKVAGHLF
jgi:hypothetical protein